MSCPWSATQAALARDELLACSRSRSVEFFFSPEEKEMLAHLIERAEEALQVAYRDVNVKPRA